MARGYVLINTAPAKEHDVYNELMKDLEKSDCKVEKVDLGALFGEHDLIVIVDAPDYNVLGNYVAETIQKMPGVINVKTLTGMNF